MAATKKTPAKGAASPATPATATPSPVRDGYDEYGTGRGGYIHVRVTEEEKERFAEITKRWGLKKEAILHRKAPDVFDAAQRVIEEILAVAGRRALTVPESNALRLLDPIRFAQASSRGALTDPPEVR
jgi:hypothetical protein